MASRENDVDTELGSRDSVAVGVDRLILERSALIAAIHRLFGGARGTGVMISGRVEEFLHLVQEFFDHEERIMAVSGYPMLVIHTNEHIHLLETITNALDAGREQGTNLDRIAKEVVAMMTTHDRYFDQVMLDYLRNRPAR